MTIEEAANILRPLIGNWGKYRKAVAAICEEFRLIDGLSSVEIGGSIKIAQQIAVGKHFEEKKEN